jgi:hypothetical protein
MKVQGTIEIDAEEFGVFSIGFDQVVMMKITRNGWEPLQLFEWASENHKVVELVPKA